VIKLKVKETSLRKVKETMERQDLQRLQMIAQIAAGIVANPNLFDKDTPIDQNWIVDQAVEIVDEIEERERRKLRAETEYPDLS
jgi:hypothetical protein